MPEPTPAAVRPKRSIPPDQVFRGGGKAGRRCRPALAILRDMRAVYGQSKERDATPGQRALRVLFETDPMSFLRDLARLESAHCTGAATEPHDDPRQSSTMPDLVVA
jgi:hypothetical protein